MTLRIYNIQDLASRYSIILPRSRDTILNANFRLMRSPIGSINYVEVGTDKCAWYSMVVSHSYYNFIFVEPYEVRCISQRATWHSTTHLIRGFSDFEDKDNHFNELLTITPSYSSVHLETFIEYRCVLRQADWTISHLNAQLIKINISLYIEVYQSTQNSCQHLYIEETKNYIGVIKTIYHARTLTTQYRGVSWLG